MKTLTDYIIIREKAISDDFCKKIIEEYQEEDWLKADTFSEGYASRRTCSSVNLSVGHDNHANYLYRKHIDRKFFNEVISKCLNHYLKIFPHFTLREDSGYELLQYTEGQYHRNHIDSYTGVPRTVTCSVMLNDDYEGGEFSFFDGEFTVPLKKGDALMFPSNFMYDHEIKTVTQGVRYSVITWFT